MSSSLFPRFALLRLVINQFMLSFICGNKSLGTGHGTRFEGGNMKIKATLVVFGLLTGIQLAGPFHLYSGPALDQQIRQVLIETRIVEASRNSALLLSVDWTDKGVFDEVRLAPGSSWLKGLGDLHLPQSKSGTGQTIPLIIERLILKSRSTWSATLSFLSPFRGAIHHRDQESERLGKV